MPMLRKAGTVGRYGGQLPTGQRLLLRQPGNNRPTRNFVRGPLAQTQHILAGISGSHELPVFLDGGLLVSG